MRNTLRETRDLVLNNPVFIVGGSRTGSEMLKTMLSASPELNFTNELYVLCPRWLHKDLRANLRTHVGDLGSPTALNAVVDLIYSGKLYGWTWKHADTELDRELLSSELGKKPLTVESILTAVLRVNAMLRNRPRPGAKFPVHYSYVPQLMKWYPQCKVIHTTRDPRAVYASQANKYIQSSDGWARRAFEKSRQFVHINIQIAWTAQIHQRLTSLPNYQLVRYEDVVTNADRTIREICLFLGIPFTAQMLVPHQYGSSFNQIRGERGVSPSSLRAWESLISPATAASIRIMQARAARILGYELEPLPKVKSTEPKD